MVNQDSKFYQVFGDSIRYFEKERNGDHYLIKELPAEKMLIALVADGISQLPCDWKASELTCMRFLEFFETLGSKPLGERIQTAISRTNEVLLKIEDKCAGLATTMSLVALGYDKNEFHFVNAGDSRIYKISNNKIQCLTTDDAIKRSETIMTPEGRRVIEQSYLTNHIGAYSMKIKLQKETLEPGELLLIASDGFYDARKSSFEKRVIELYKSTNLENDFSALIKLLELSAKDDMTAIIIKKS